MAYQYTIQDLRKELGDDLIPCDRYSLTLEDFLHFEVIGKSYVSLLLSAFEDFFHSEWSLCQQKCKVLLDITWEHLNTGHWKDVHIAWRNAYSLASFLKSLSEFSLLSPSDDVVCCIHSCDMGLLMGAPILNNLLARVADKLQQIQDNRTEARAAEEVTNVLMSKRLKVETISDFSANIPAGDSVAIEFSPSLERFSKVYMATGTPVILRNCMDHWPAMSHNRWSPEYVKKVAGCRLVPVELGSKYTDDSWSQTLMPVKEFCEVYVEHHKDSSSLSGVSSIGYLAQHQLFDQILRLRNDILIPDYCALSAEADDVCPPVDINAWFGPSGTVSPLHQDAKHNLLAQVFGTKYLRLIDPTLTHRLYPHSSHLLSTTSRVDIENPDLEQFPLFDGLPFLNCILHEGDMLYLPPMYWHYVRALSISFSVSFWWQ